MVQWFLSEGDSDCPLNNRHGKANGIVQQDRLGLKGTAFYRWRAHRWEVSHYRGRLCDKLHQGILSLKVWPFCTFLLNFESVSSGFIKLTQANNSVSKCQNERPDPGFQRENNNIIKEVKKRGVLLC